MAIALAAIDFYFFFITLGQNHSVVFISNCDARAVLGFTDTILIKVEELDASQTSNSYSNAIGQRPTVIEQKPCPDAMLPIPRPRPCQRLMVIVPNADLHEARLAQRLSDMATYNHAEVLLLAIGLSWAEEPNVRLRLALLGALMEGVGVTTQAEVFPNEDWLTILQRLYLPGDLLVCFPEHDLSIGKASPIGQSQPIARVLEFMHMPTCELQGYVIALEPHDSWLENLKGWLLPMSIVIGMFAFQVLLVHWTQDWNNWAQKALMSITVIVELVSITFMTTG